LEIDGALHGISGTGELDQDAVAGNLEDAAPVPGDQRFQDIAAQGDGPTDIRLLHLLNLAWPIS